MNTLQSSALPIDAAERKAAPVFSGVLMYFPKTMVALARLSLAGNIQHYGPGTPLHWNREVSADHLDCMVRHAMQSRTFDAKDNILHDVKAAWRALANCEEALDSLDAVGPGEPVERELTPSEKAAYADPVKFITAHVPPFVDDEEPGSLKNGEAYREPGNYGGTD